MFEHLDVSALTGKRIKEDENSTKKRHLLFNHSFGFDDFSIVGSNSNDFLRLP